MEELESQIAKIQLGAPKHTSSFVYVLAEKAAGSDAELYLVCELPILNPAAIESCEKISLSIASALKRTYRKSLSDSMFENAIAQINEELGKLAELGQTHWINKLNCIIGVKNGSAFHIATCGKVAAYLLRSNEFTDISCSPGTSHPLKTFENYASGKIRLGDLLIFSTTQMFNYLSMDRFKTILTTSPFLNAAQTVIELIKDNAGPEVAFGTILNMQVQPGQTIEEDIDLEEYLQERPAAGIPVWSKAINYIKATFALDKSKRVPKTTLPQLPLKQRAKNTWYKISDSLSRGWKIASAGMHSLSSWGGSTLNPKNFRSFSPQKKFFLISAIILLLAFVTNVVITARYRKIQQTQQSFTGQLQEALGLLANADSYLMFNDNSSARNTLAKVSGMIPDKTENLDPANKELYGKVSAQLAEVRQKMEKALDVKVTSLAGFGQADRLIKIPGALAVQIGGNLISYNKSTGSMEDGALKLPQTALGSVFMQKNAAAVYNGGSLFAWDFSAGKTGNGFSQSVPAQDAYAGMAYYPTNSRVYLVDKAAGQIVSFLLNQTAFGKPVVAARDPNLSSAQDIAIDGAIYIINSQGITKYLSGQPANFSMPPLLDPFSGSGKIYTEKNYSYIYLLDTGSNRVIIMDKKGNLVGTIKHEDFTKLKDFQVDEAGKVIYLLNDSNLLKVEYSL